MFTSMSMVEVSAVVVVKESLLVVEKFIFFIFCFVLGVTVYKEIIF